MPVLNAVQIVESFWADVWVARNPEAVGRNNGFLGLPPDERPLEMTGTAVWAVRADGKLLHNWVERSAWECYQRLINH